MTVMPAVWSAGPRWRPKKPPAPVTRTLRDRSRDPSNRSEDMFKFDTPQAKQYVLEDSSLIGPYLEPEPQEKVGCTPQLQLPVKAGKANGNGGRYLGASEDSGKAQVRPFLGRRDRIGIRRTPPCRGAGEGGAPNCRHRC